MPDANGPTVLVVEDEVLIRLDLVSYLECENVQVREAGSADEALAILTNDSSIHAVFTDVRMPGTVDGLALARQVRACWPSVFVVICSANHISESDQAAFGRLEKPYVQQDVADMITKLKGLLALQASGEVVAFAVAITKVGDATVQMQAGTTTLEEPSH